MLGLPSRRVTLVFKAEMSACAVLSCVVAVTKASVRVLFVFVKADTGVLPSEAVAVARFASASAVWV